MITVYASQIIFYYFIVVIIENFIYKLSLFCHVLKIATMEHDENIPKQIRKAFAIAAGWWVSQSKARMDSPSGGDHIFKEGGVPETSGTIKARGLLTPPTPEKLASFHNALLEVLVEEYVAQHSNLRATLSQAVLSAEPLDRGKKSALFDMLNPLQQEYLRRIYPSSPLRMPQDWMRAYTLFFRYQFRGELSTNWVPNHLLNRVLTKANSDMGELRIGAKESMSLLDGVIKIRGGYRSPQEILFVPELEDREQAALYFQIAKELKIEALKPYLPIVKDVLPNVPGDLTQDSINGKINNLTKEMEGRYKIRTVRFRGEP
jgi:hypothetical protein